MPCLVRAPDRHGRRARALVRSSRELRVAVKTALRASRIGLALVEEVVEEPVVTVNAFSRGGVFHALTVTDRAPLTHVWESEHADEAVRRGAAGGRGARDLRRARPSTQLRIGPDGPRVLELSARTGGGHEAELCQAALGVDLNGLALSAALGRADLRAAPQAPCRAGAACVRFLTGAGVAEGLDEAESVDGVEWARVYGGSDRAGAVLATGESRDQALERATRAAEYVRFRAADAQALA